MDNDLITQNCEELLKLFEEAVHRNLADGILLSGGLDTSVIAAVAIRYNRPKAITVSLDNSPDAAYARLVANLFRLEHKVVAVDVKRVESAARDVVKIMRTFDPMEVRNDASILIGLRAAKKEGVKTILTGDAGDELFAGYSFLFEKGLDQLDQRLQNMWRTMRFSSVPLAKSLGMEARLPFLEERFKEFAKSMSPELKVREENGRLCGKWILRRAFQKSLPESILWRSKMPIEQGSGSSKLQAHFASKISDVKFAAKAKEYLHSDGVRIYDKEQLAYYEFFKNEFGIPRGTGEGAKLCRGCGSWLMEVMSYCKTCGASPA